VITEPPSIRPCCSDCGAEDAPHLGELRTTRVADGVVRDARVYRCTGCLAKRRAGVAA
jgi:hypothetical protein